jgi:hypothetical protein
MLTDVPNLEDENSMLLKLQSPARQLRKTDLNYTMQKPKNLHVCGDCFPWGMVQTIHLPFCVKHKNAWSYMPRESCVKCVSKHNYFQAASEETYSKWTVQEWLVPFLHVIV